MKNKSVIALVTDKIKMSNSSVFAKDEASVNKIRFLMMMRLAVLKTNGHKSIPLLDACR